MSASPDNISRRAVLAGGAALVVSFSLLPAMRVASSEMKPRSARQNRRIESR